MSKRFLLLLTCVLSLAILAEDALICFGKSTPFAALEHPTEKGEKGSEESEVKTINYLHPFMESAVCENAESQKNNAAAHYKEHFPGTPYLAVFSPPPERA